MDDIQVSIICNAYNHEKYIRDAMEGFVMQRTTFPFEILVHDDASTDKTADIIREYEKRYPEIVKPIYETVNQYSKRDGSLQRIQYGRVQGRYIALCEGDDYWTDPLKLQKQFDALEANPNVDICASGTKTDVNGKVQAQVFPSNEDGLFTPDEVIRGGGGFVATGSLMYRKEVRENSLPFFYKMSGDYPLQITGSLRGGMLYLGAPMSVFRAETIGSWTVRMNQNLEARKKHNDRVCEMLQQLNTDTAGKYQKAILEAINDLKFECLVQAREYRAICASQYNIQFRKMPSYRRAVMKIGQYCPKAASLIFDLRRRMR